MRSLLSVVSAVVALLLLGAVSASAEQFDDTPPPAPTEVVDPYGDGEDENGLIPDDNGEDIDEELNSQPFADQDTDPVAVSEQDVAADQTQDSEGIDENRATVTQLPDTGVGPIYHPCMDGHCDGLRIIAIGAIQLFIVGIALLGIWKWEGRKRKY